MLHKEELLALTMKSSDIFHDQDCNAVSRFMPLLTQDGKSSSSLLDPAKQLHKNILMPTLRFRQKSRQKNMPIGFYTGAVVVFNSLLVALLWRRKRLGSFADLSLSDILLLGAGTHKLSCVITKDLITTPFRAPFTEVQDFLGYGEVQEKAKDKGIGRKRNNEKDLLQ